MKYKKGFTLIELMIVMVIMGILATIGVTAFISSQIKGRDVTRKANLRAIASALELYYNDKGAYPIGASGTFSSCYTTTLSGPGACGTSYPVFKDTANTSTIYMAQFPTDPVISQKYYYVSDATGKQYQMYAHLENTQDPAIITPAAAGTNCGTAACNFGLASTNTLP